MPNNLEGLEARQGCSTERPLDEVIFSCWAPAARRVHLAGDFNDWNPSAYAMREARDGWWELRLAVSRGHHLYYFLIDGSPVLDARAPGVGRNRRGESASLIRVD